jgi:hypothetical protein
MVEDAGHSLGSGLSPESRRSFLGALLSVGGFFVGALLSVPLIRFALFPHFAIRGSSNTSFALPAYSESG